jgi:hypothetical protein
MGDEILCEQQGIKETRTPVNHPVTVFVHYIVALPYLAFADSSANYRQCPNESEKARIIGVEFLNNWHILSGHFQIMRKSRKERSIQLLSM